MCVRSKFGRVDISRARGTSNLSFILHAVLISTLGLVAAGRASALTVDEARERCRETVGRPIVQACMQGGGGDREACRARAHPKFHACVQAAMNAANGRANIAPAIPTEATPSVEKTATAAAPPSFAPPPRTIADITVILDAERPDSKQIEQWKAASDAKPPGNAAPANLAKFYYDRGNARTQLGRLSESIEDANAAVEAAGKTGDPRLLGRVEQFLGMQQARAGKPKQAMAVFLRRAADINVRGARGQQFNNNRLISDFYLQMGDIPQAEAYLRRNTTLLAEARTSGMPGWRAIYPIFGQNWESEVERQRGMIFEARGQFHEAELSYRTAELRKRASIKGLLTQSDASPEAQLLQAADILVRDQARMKARQGRLAEAEVDARRALVATLKEQGKYNPITPTYIMGLVEILIEQGRYEEAEKLIRAAIEINRRVGVTDDSRNTVRKLAALAGTLNLERKQSEAAAAYADLDRATANWEPQRREELLLTGPHIYLLYASGRVDEGIVAAQTLLQRQVFRFGDDHYLSALARGTLAVGYMRAGRDQEAASQFKAAIPILVAGARENADEDDTRNIVARSERLQRVVEAYMRLLARHNDDPRIDPGSETFHLAEEIRGRSVQHAIVESSARMTARDPALAELLRKAQDLSKEVSAQLGLLNNVLALPVEEREEATVRGLRAEINKLRAESDKTRQEISRKYPSYADILAPKALTVEEVRASLRPGEALLSFYFGRMGGFVWAIPKEGSIGFSVIPITFGEMEAKVSAVRKTLEPVAGFIPQFDLADAYELYEQLLRPVEPAWRSARSLIVVTNGALGLLPLSLLPTAPSQVSEESRPRFAGYRDVPWLARTHSVMQVPSTYALLTLRRLPVGSPARQSFVGFGDPLFNEEQVAEAAREEKQESLRVAAASEPIATSAAGSVTRGSSLVGRRQVNTRGLDHADIESLPRLRDTSLELKAMAQALGADPSRSLYLGKDANEENVKKIDLARFRVVAFSTHGLVAGDLDGLTQPALALSAPSVTGKGGDGLLTMDEIMGLKLDADWVVLSACNTAAGASAGAEAASGLGRAFFYAGSRALLVTNWSVHSESARDLVSDLFRRQHTDPNLSRSEALRQAMLTVLDEGGFSVAGQTLFTYAHPWFWAPYSIIGDGG
jgi:CHAT domain-containing protein